MGKGASVQTRRQLAKWASGTQMHRNIWDDRNSLGTTPCESKSPPADQCWSKSPGFTSLCSHQMGHVQPAEKPLLVINNGYSQRWDVLKKLELVPVELRLEE